MKTFSAAAIAALDAGTAIVSGAIKVATPTPFRAWGGYGSLSLDSEAHSGVGDKLLCQVSGGQLGSGEMGATVRLSGVDPKVLAGLDFGLARGVDAVLRRLIFDSAGTTLLQAYVFLRGRLDKLTTDEVVGGPASITGSIEGAARGLGRRSVRRKSDADQRLTKVDDGGRKSTSHAPNKVLYWGGKVPAQAGAALSNPFYGFKWGPFDFTRGAIP